MYDKQLTFYVSVSCWLWFTVKWTVTDQLVQVVFDPGKIGERTDGHQTAQGKVEQLVAEKRDEPAVTVLRGRGEESQVMNIGDIS